MGHDPTSNRRDMQEHYDNAPEDQLLAEQKECLPNGVLGFLDIPKIVIQDGIPSDAIDTVKAYLNGQMGMMDVIKKLDEVRIRAIKPEVILTK